MRPGWCPRLAASRLRLSPLLPCVPLAGFPRDAPSCAAYRVVVGVQKDLQAHLRCERNNKRHGGGQTRPLRVERSFP